jgi:hypothetical protein
VTFPNDFFAEKRQERVSLRGSMHVTLFGRAKSKTVALGKRPVNTFDGLQCAAGPIKDLYCLSPFRWPERLINAEFPDGYRRTFAHTISYSPFPAELGFNTVDSDSIWMPAAAREVTFVEKEPLGHIRLDFDFPNIKLIDERQ